MKWLPCCDCICKADDAVLVDAHHPREKKPAVVANGLKQQKSVLLDESATLLDQKRSKLLTAAASSSLYYFDAKEEEWEIEEEDFFDAMDMSECLVVDETQNNNTLIAMRRRAHTVDDNRLLGKRVSVKSEEWGFPGSLDARQLASYQDFRAELRRRGGVYREMVYCYKEIESEPYALCRFLRWANFNPHRVFKYMDENVQQWQEAKNHNFYPDANVGCPLSVLLTQFPSVYTGFAKEGFPVCYFHSSRLSIEGIDCVTDVERLPNFIWYTMMHDIKRIYAEAIAKNPSLGRLEQITVLNLDGLSPNLMTPRTYAASQHADAVVQIFPEMLYRLIIINAPRFFTYIWNTFKYVLDPNTTKRIEIYSSGAKGIERLKELIDETELPSDYGGCAMSTSESILREGRKGPVPRRQIVELMTIKRRRETVFEFELTSDEKISFEIHTRSTSSTEFSLLNEQKEVIKRIDVKQMGDVPYCVPFVETKGPGRFSVAGCHSEGPSSTEYFLVVGEVFAIRDEVISAESR